MNSAFFKSVVKAIVVEGTPPRVVTTVIMVTAADRAEAHADIGSIEKPNEATWLFAENDWLEREARRACASMDAISCCIVKGNALTIRASSTDQGSLKNDCTKLDEGDLA